MLVRPSHKRREDIFFLLMVASVLTVNVIGFARTYFLAGVFRAPLPSRIVHLHAALFTSWLLLLMTQTLLVSTGNIRMHRRLGILGGVLAVLMTIVGPLALAGALQRHAFKTEAGSAFLLTADVEGLALFTVFVALGLARRNDAVQHKRLMLFATIAILGPALSRWSFHFMDWAPAIFLLWLSFPLAIVLFDFFVRGKPHKVSVVSSLCILLYLLSAGPVSSTSMVRGMTRAIAASSPQAVRK